MTVVTEKRVPATTATLRAIAMLLKYFLLRFLSAIPKSDIPKTPSAVRVLHE